MKILVYFFIVFSIKTIYEISNIRENLTRIRAYEQLKKVCERRHSSNRKNFSSNYIDQRPNFALGNFKRPFDAPFLLIVLRWATP